MVGAFRDLVKINERAGRLAGRPAKSSDKMVVSGMHLMPADLARAKRVALIKDRPVSYYMRVSFLKVLAEDEAELGITDVASTAEQQ